MAVSPERKGGARVKKAHRWIPQSLFVTATDTEVGKTLVTCGLARLFSKQGIDVGVMKPVSAGGDVSEDARQLAAAAKVKDPISLINPYHFRHPLAPAVAAKLGRRTLRPTKIMTAFRRLQRRHDIVLVEGVGGVYVPLTKNYFVLDLITAMQLPVLIVSRIGLGTINHTLLTVAALQARRLQIYGILLNGLKKRGLAEATNPEVIAQRSGVPVLGVLPHRPAFARNVSTLARDLRKV